MYLPAPLNDIFRIIIYLIFLRLIIKLGGEIGTHPSKEGVKQNDGYMYIAQVFQII